VATVITSECINCGACEPECPNAAIYQSGIEWELDGQRHAPISIDVFYIVPEKCTECVGFYEQEACAAVCPVDCCVPDPNMPESEDVLIERARKLHPETTIGADFPSRFRKQGAGIVPAAAPPPSAAAEAPRPKPAPAAAPPSPAAGEEAPRPNRPAPAAAPSSPAAAPLPKPVPAAAPPQAAATVEAVPSSAPPSLGEWEIPIVCRGCGGEYTVAFQYMRPGTVSRCPHCQGSFVPSRSTYLGISAELERFSRRWQRRLEEFEEKRCHAVEEVKGRIRVFTSEGHTTSGARRRRWFG